MTARRDDQIQNVAGLAVVVALLLVFGLTIAPLVPALVWGGILAIAIDPWHRRLCQILRGRRNLSTAVMGIGLACFFVLPAIGIGQALLALVPDVLSWVEKLASEGPGAPPALLESIPILGQRLHQLWTDVAEDTAQLVTRFESEIATTLAWLLHEANAVGTFVLEFALGVLFAAIVLQNSDGLSDLSMRFARRLGGDYGYRLTTMSVDTLRHAVRGTLGAAVAQAAVSAIGYLIVGIDHWLLLATLTLFLALTPIGPILIWGPLCIWFLAEGAYGEGIFLLVWGAVVVGMTDNIVRPLLVSRGGGLTSSLAFVGALAGLLAWGIIGLFLGPSIIAVAREMIVQFVATDTKELSEAPVDN